MRGAGRLELGSSREPQPSAARGGKPGASLTAVVAGLSIPKELELAHRPHRLSAKPRLGLGFRPDAKVLVGGITLGIGKQVAQQLLE